MTKTKRKQKTRVRCTGLLDRDERRIVSAIRRGAQYEEVSDVARANRGHHVYEYVWVDQLIDIIRKLASRSNTKLSDDAT